MCISIVSTRVGLLFIHRCVSLLCVSIRKATRCLEEKRKLNENTDYLDVCGREINELNRLSGFFFAKLCAKFVITFFGVFSKDGAFILFPFFPLVGDNTLNFFGFVTIFPFFFFAARHYDLPTRNDFEAKIFRIFFCSTT